MVITVADTGLHTDFVEQCASSVFESHSCREYRIVVQTYSPEVILFTENGNLEITSEIWGCYGHPEIDLYASKENNQYPMFFSPRQTQVATGSALCISSSGPDPTLAFCKTYCIGGPLHR